jgi:rod shape determining protein RodA
MFNLRSWRHFDFVMLGLVILLMLFGIVMIRSATTNAIDPDLINRVPRQIQFGVVGLVMIFVFAATDYRLLGSIHNWIYGAMLALLGLVAVLGVVGAAGAQRWLTVGIPIQPSEVSKVLLVLTLAQYLSTRYERIGRIQTLLGSLFYVALPAGLIFIQPDLSTAIVLIVIWFVMVWGAGLRLQHIAMFLIVIMVVFPIVWGAMAEYQRGRIIQFINPEADPDAQYNIEQAKIAIGSGGLLGKGYTQGTQSQLRYLRVRHTDFIFSVIAEELGFVGVLAVLLLLGALIFRILRAAKLARDPLGSLICYGVAGNIFFQTVVSVGMNLAMIPVTGLTLPLISSGISSLMTTMMGIGLVQSVIVRHKQMDF